MNFLQIWQASILSAWGQVGPTLGFAIVTILAAVIVFVVALIISYWAKRIIVELLKALQFNDLMKTAGIEGFLKKADIKLSPTEIVAEFVHWIVILVGFIAAVNVLGLTAVVDVLMRLLGYLPNVFAGALILAAGFVVAKITDGLVRGALAAVDPESSRPVGRLSYWVVLILAFFAALSQLKIAEALTEAVFQTLSWATALALGLLIGLGGKDLIAKILIDWYEKVKK